MCRPTSQVQISVAKTTKIYLCINNSLFIPGRVVNACVVATIAATGKKSITTYKTQRFSTFTKDLKSLALWLSDNNCRQEKID